MTTELNEYEQEAKDFLDETNTELIIELVDYGFYFPGDKEERDIYQFTLKRGGSSYTGRFGNSLVDTKINKEPTAYGILACLDGYCPDDFEEWCDEYGYDNDSIKDCKLYENCIKESRGLRNLYSQDELHKLAEIN